MLRVLGCFFALSAGLLWAQAPKDGPAAKGAKWEKEIAAMEKRMAEKPPEKGGILFAGSSSIRLWDLAKAFPEWKPINAGFGGSVIEESTLFAKRIITKHEPKTIVFYAGDNDIAGGRKPEQLLADFQAFVKIVHADLPKTKIHFIAVKPSIARWKMFETQKKANDLIREYCSKDERLGYIDVVPLMLGDDGKPKEEFFVKDGLHMTPKGYEVWNQAVRRALKQ